MSPKSRSPEISESSALLAPVPERHLIAGLKTLAEHGQVWFGSDVTTVFEELEKNGAKSFATYIYAAISKSRTSPAETSITWIGRYIGYESATPGRRPKWRPSTTETDTGFKLWWKLDFLRRLDDSEAIPMRKMGAPAANKTYLPNFAPERPYRVRANTELLNIVKAWMREHGLSE